MEKSYDFYIDLFFKEFSHRAGESVFIFSSFLNLDFPLKFCRGLITYVTWLKMPRKKVKMKIIQCYVMKGSPPPDDWQPLFFQLFPLFRLDSDSVQQMKSLLSTTLKIRYFVMIPLQTMLLLKLMYASSNLVTYQVN